MLLWIEELLTRNAQVSFHSYRSQAFTDCVGVLPIEEYLGIFSQVIHEQLESWFNLVCFWS